MAQIRMTPAELKSKAARYGRGSEQVLEVLKDLRNLQSELRGEWEGAAFRQFDSQFEQLQPKVQDFAELLKEIQTQLEKTADAVQQTDEQLSKNFGLR